MSNKHVGIGDFRKKARMLNVGHGNFVAVKSIVTVVDSSSLPLKRLREKAGEQNRLVDATAGRKMRSMLVTDSGYVILSCLAAHTLSERLDTGRLEYSPSQLELEDGEFVS